MPTTIGEMTPAEFEQLVNDVLDRREARRAPPPSNRQADADAERMRLTRRFLGMPPTGQGNPPPPEGEP